MTGKTPRLELPEKDQEQSATLCLRLLQTTDVHGHILPFDYYSNQKDQPNGLARIATLVERARAEFGAENCLLFDTGDSLQGTPLTDITPHAGHGWRGRHPVLRAMNLMGYDAASLGNHEFNFGLDWLLGTLTEACFPVTCANALTQVGQTPDQDQFLLPPYLILPRRMYDTDGSLHDIKIGVMGLVPPQIMTWDYVHLAQRLSTRDMVETARALVPEIRAAGADLVILLAHTGIDPGPDRPGMENAARALSRVPGVDVLLAGHSHKIFPSPNHAGIPGVEIKRATLNGTPCINAGFAGSHLGQIDLTLKRNAGKWHVSEHAALLRQAAPAPACPRITRSIARAHAHTLRLTDRVIGSSSAPLHSYLSLVRNDPTVQLVNDAQRMALVRALADTPYADLTVLSASAPFKSGGRAGPSHFTDIPEGILRLRNIADLYPFPNQLCGLLVTGLDLRDWLERAVICFNRILPGMKDRPLLDAEVPGHDFDVIDGLTYTIDLTEPPRYDNFGNLLDGAAHRIGNLCHAGRPLSDTDRFVIATNSYRASGGGPFRELAKHRLVYSSAHSVRDLVARFVSQHAVLTPRARESWSFKPIPDTSVLIETGPGLRSYPDDIATIGAIDLGDNSAGFACLRLPFTQTATGAEKAPVPSLAMAASRPYITGREVGAGRHLANPVRSGRKQP